MSVSSSLPLSLFLFLSLPLSLPSSSSLLHSLIYYHPFIPQSPPSASHPIPRLSSYPSPPHPLPSLRSAPYLTGMRPREDRVYEARVSMRDGGSLSALTARVSLITLHNNIRCSTYSFHTTLLHARVGNIRNLL
jgi:hypothetical protein